MGQQPTEKEMLDYLAKTGALDLSMRDGDLHFDGPIVVFGMRNANIIEAMVEELEETQRCGEWNLKYAKDGQMYIFEPPADLHPEDRKRIERRVQELADQGVVFNEDENPDVSKPLH